MPQGDDDKSDSDRSASADGTSLIAETSSSDEKTSSHSSDSDSESSRSKSSSVVTDDEEKATHHRRHLSHGFTDRDDGFGAHSAKILTAPKGHLDAMDGARRKKGSKKGGAYTDEVARRERAERLKKAHKEEEPRFFQRPRVRQYIDPINKIIVREDEDRKATWNELFYDLIFVATVASMGHDLAFKSNGNALGAFLLFFSPVWMAWNSTTIYINRFDEEDFVHKIFFFLQMVSVMGVAIFHSTALKDGQGFSAFMVGVSVAFSRLLIVFMYGIAAFWIPIARPVSYATMCIASIVALIWLIGGFVALAGGALSVVVTIFALASISEATMYMSMPPIRLFSGCFKPTPWIPFAIEHIAERYGLFTIIMLGEIIVSALSNAQTVISFGAVAGAAAAVTIAFNLQWIYFDVEKQGAGICTHAVRRHWTSGIAWLYIHLPLHASILALGAGILNLMTVLVNTAAFNAQPSGFALDVLHTGAVTAAITDKPVFKSDMKWLFALGFSSTLGCIAIVGMLHESRQNARLRWELRVLYRLIIATIVACLPVTDLDDPLSFLLIAAGLSLSIVVVETYGLQFAKHHHWWTNATSFKQEIEVHSPIPLSRKNYAQLMMKFEQKILEAKNEMAEKEALVEDAKAALEELESELHVLRQKYGDVSLP